MASIHVFSGLAAMAGLTLLATGVSAQRTAPILTGSQSSYITVSTQSGVCPCSDCTLRAGRTTVRFQYDDKAKKGLDTAGAAAMAAATRQAGADVKTQAAAPGLCPSLCEPRGVESSVSPATAYGGSGGEGNTSSSWKITGTCVDNRKYVADPNHPTISVPQTVSTTRPVTPPVAVKPSYTAAPLVETKPTYTASTPGLPTSTAVKPVALVAKPAPAPTCAKGQKLVTVGGKSVCSGAAGAAAAGH